MLILGIDPGLATVGFGLIESKPLELLDFGVISTPAGAPVGERLCVLYEDMQALVAQMRPDLVALEKLFFYRMGNTILVAQARGVVLLALAQQQLPIVEFTPAQVKQGITGYGRAPKAEVQQAVAREFALESIPQPDDAADAIALALTALWQSQLS